MFKFLVNNGSNEARFETQAEGIIWVETTFGQGTPYTIVDVTAEKESQDALAYLSSTDWYVIREADNGTPVPADIRAAREDARSKVIS